MGCPQTMIRQGPYTDDQSSLFRRHCMVSGLLTSSIKQLLKVSSRMSPLLIEINSIMMYKLHDRNFSTTSGRALTQQTHINTIEKKYFDYEYMNIKL